MTLLLPAEGEGGGGCCFVVGQVDDDERIDVAEGEVRAAVAGGRVEDLLAGLLEFVPYLGPILAAMRDPHLAEVPLRAFASALVETFVREVYATRRLTEYLTENFCPQTSQVLGINIREGCAEAIQQNQEQLRQFIAKSTERQNFGLFSIYQTNLSLKELVPGGIAQLLPETLLPSYEFQTVGVLMQFMTFKAEQAQR